MGNKLDKKSNVNKVESNKKSIFKGFSNRKLKSNSKNAESKVEPNAESKVEILNDAIILNENDSKNYELFKKTYNATIFVEASPEFRLYGIRDSSLNIVQQHLMYNALDNKTFEDYDYLLGPYFYTKMKILLH